MYDIEEEGGKILASLSLKKAPLKPPVENEILSRDSLISQDLYILALKCPY